MLRRESTEEEKSIVAVIASVTRPGTRVMVDGRPVFLADLRVCCDGADPIMGYWCCLPPGHEGAQCYTVVKGVHFTPVEGRGKEVAMPDKRA